mmetsp:Transcript_46550/g.122937  ORF Transcript_46550/g.122937 Transcript_46550/m.122937 type:complete len:253 (+) Transcript_46550:694-1452(+)
MHVVHAEGAPLFHLHRHPPGDVCPELPRHPLADVRGVQALDAEDDFLAVHGVGVQVHLLEDVDDEKGVHVHPLLAFDLHNAVVVHPHLLLEDAVYTELWRPARHPIRLVVHGRLLVIREAPSERDVHAHFHGTLDQVQVERASDTHAHLTANIWRRGRLVLRVHHGVELLPRGLAPVCLLVQAVRRELHLFGELPKVRGEPALGLLGVEAPRLGRRVVLAVPRGVRGRQIILALARGLRQRSQMQGVEDAMR